MHFANTHTHSTFSDGPYTPEELAKLAKKLGYRAIVLTDHDTVQGTYFMQKAARKEGLLSILGCEFTTVEFGQGFHLLGYDFNPEEPTIKKFLERGAGKQRCWAQTLLRWAHEKGRWLEVSWEEVCEAYPYNDYLGNNHIFNVLVKKGVLKHEDYFDFFNPDFCWTEELAAKFEAETNLKEPSTIDVIHAIRQAGGVPVLAHPINQVQYVPALIEAGLMGVESYYRDLTDEEIRQLNVLADESGLYKTGGMDHYGVLGGYEDLFPDYECELNRNTQHEQDFMNLYLRKLG